MYLLGDYPPPDHNTIARFRSRYLAGNEQELLEQLVDMLRTWGFLSLENVFTQSWQLHFDHSCLVQINLANKQLTRTKLYFFEIIG